MILNIIKRDIIIASRSGSSALNGLIFFCLFIALASISLGGTNEVLKPLSPALIWLAIVFSTMLSYQNIFQEDYKDGNLSQLRLGGISALNICIAKSFSFSIQSIFPLILSIPIVAVFLDMPLSEIKTIIATLIIATPGLTVYGVFSSAIAAKIRGGTFFIVLITSPFLIPLLIFGLESMNSASDVDIFNSELRVLIGLSLIASAIGLPASAAALKTNLE